MNSRPVCKTQRVVRSAGQTSLKILHHYASTFRLVSRIQGVRHAGQHGHSGASPRRARIEGHAGGSSGRPSTKPYRCSFLQARRSSPSPTCGPTGRVGSSGSSSIRRGKRARWRWRSRWRARRGLEKQYAKKMLGDWSFGAHRGHFGLKMLGLV